MRTYEALYIVSPELDDDAIQTIAKETEALVVKNEGAIVRSEIWGKRKLAYTVKKFTEGAYILLRFQATPEFIRRLETYFKLSEQIIRYLVVYLDEHTLKLEALQQKRKEDEMRSGGRRDNDDDDDDGDERDECFNRFDRDGGRDGEGRRGGRRGRRGDDEEFGDDD